MREHLLKKWMKKHGKKKEGVNIMNIKFILKTILELIVSLAAGGALIFGIMRGLSLLASELQSPGTVSLSATILYIFSFYIIINNIGYIAKYICEGSREELNNGK